MKKKIVIVISSVLMAFTMTASVFSIITFVKVNEDKSEKAIEIVKENFDQKMSNLNCSSGKLSNGWYIIRVEDYTTEGMHFEYVFLVNVNTKECIKLKGI